MPYQPIAAAAGQSTTLSARREGLDWGMTDERDQTKHPGRNVRLDTLVRLRWLAVIGQTTAVLVVYVGLDFDLPFWACLTVIGLAAWLNVALRIRFPLM